jgi:hypothetical protein
MTDKEKFANLVLQVQAPPPDVMALGHIMRDWLEACVADAGTKVDTGGGFGCYDLWVKMGGKDVFIQLQERPSAPRHDHIEPQ